MTAPAIDTEPLNQALAELREGATSWTTTPIAERIALLERLLPRIADSAADMAAAGARAKGYGPDSPWAAEDWIGAPWALAQNVRACLHVLRRIAAGKEPVEAGAVHVRDGRTRVDVFPATGWDTLLLNGFTAEVWMRSGITAQRVRDRPPASTAAGPDAQPSPWSWVRATSRPSPRSTSSTSSTPRARSSSRR